MRLTLTEKTVLDPGYRRACAPARDETAQTSRLARKQRGEKMQLTPRIERVCGLSEADLIRRMQASGVGRPSTYAATLEALRRHGYIETQDGALQVTQRGQQALDFLEARYPFLLDPDFSARIEAGLDALAEGRRMTYETLLSELLKTLQGETS
ncbi:MAG: DNA topoisomerase [Anaerolineales bacterium]|nr:DNA topoisomerase [Anaerolineales bacterium]